MVWWYTGRSSLIPPISSRAGLLQVLQKHRPSHYLHTPVDRSLQPPPFLPTDLRIVRDGREERKAWILYAIEPHVFDLEVAEPMEDPPLRPRPAEGCRACF